jgi:site-specific DNA-methyltransferase (adenine-specific)
MAKYSCEICQSVFSQKGHLEAHKKRKRPCKKDNTIEALVEKKVQEMLTKTMEGAVKFDPTTTTSIQLHQMDYTLKTIPELKELCKQRKIKGISGKLKADLVKLLEPTSSVAVVSPTSAPITEPTSVTITGTPTETTLNLTDMINKVSYGECVAMMKKIPANSIDMVCTDPPYFLDGLGDDWNKESLDTKGSSAVVGNLPKGMKFDRNQSKKFNEFYSKVSAEIFRILKPGGAFVSFSSPRLYHSMAMAIEDEGFEIRDMLGWIYTQSQVKAFSQDHIIDKDKSLTTEQKTKLKETCTNWKTPQLKPAIEPMCLAVKPIAGRYIDNFQKYGTGLMNTSEETKTGEGFFPSNIITTEKVEESMDRVFLVSKPNKAEKGDYNTHLSVKPVHLISHLVKLFTKEDAIVLDPFMGSGTTAVACVQAKRRFVGFDINKEYIKITERRIKDSTSQTSA